MTARFCRSSRQRRTSDAATRAARRAFICHWSYRGFATARGPRGASLDELWSDGACTACARMQRAPALLGHRALVRARSEPSRRQPLTARSIWRIGVWSSRVRGHRLARSTRGPPSAKRWGQRGSSRAHETRTRPLRGVRGGGTTAGTQVITPLRGLRAPGSGGGARSLQSGEWRAWRRCARGRVRATSVSARMWRIARGTPASRNASPECRDYTTVSAELYGIRIFHRSAQNYNGC